MSRLIGKKEVLIRYPTNVKPLAFTSSVIVEGREETGYFPFGKSV